MVPCYQAFRSRCPDCEAEIFLNQPSLSEILQHLKSWNRDDWNINLLCQKCGHGYRHSGPHAEDLIMLDGLDPFLSPGGPTVFRVAFECASSNCEVPVICHALRGKNATIESVTEELQKWESAGVQCRCVRGFPPLRPLKFQSTFFVPMR